MTIIIIGYSVYAVIGFEQDSYILAERGEPYTLNVSLLRGSLSQVITVTVISTPGTAGVEDLNSGQ